MRRVLLAWVSLRLVVLAAVLTWSSRLLAAVLARLPDPHSLAKRGVISTQSLLLRQHAVLGVVGVVIVAAFVLPRLSGRARWVGGAVALGLAVALVPSPVFAVGFAYVLLSLGSWALPVPVVVVPGTELIAPLPLLRGLGLPWRAAAVPASAVLTFAALGLDTVARFDTYEKRLFAPWPTSLVDPRAELIEAAPAGHKCDYHDVDLVGDRAIVVAESSGRLLNFPGGATAKLPGLWAPGLGLALDSETDPATGITYLMGGPDWVRSLRWTGRWEEGARSPQLQPPQPIAYLRLYDDRLALVSVNAHSEGLHPVLTTLDLALRDVRNLPVHDPQGQPLPTIRDIEWLPTLHRLVLAPDMGDRLFLLDPDTGLATPWLQVPTQDGRPHWSAALGELILPIPTRLELWFINPATGAVRTIPTQPGVRTADVDVARGVVLTASVLTGQVLVQDLHTGAVRDRIGTVMPMARTLKVDETKHEAWLSTWTALYRIRY